MDDQSKDVGPTTSIHEAWFEQFGLKSTDCANQVFWSQSEWLVGSDFSGAATGYSGLGQRLLPLGHHCEADHLMILSIPLS